MALFPLLRLAVRLLPVALLLPTSATRRTHGNVIRRPTIPTVGLGTSLSAPVVSRNGTELPPYDTVYYFDQLIDHNKPWLGTFRQRYWHSWEYYEPGGPVVLMTPGETNADGFSGYLTNRTLNGLIADQQNGTTVVLEHRYYGFSNPYPDLSVTSLKVHTIQHAIDDLDYFAKNVNLPMPNGDQVTPDKAPWTLIGGSYAGALTSWTMVNKPNVFFAGYSSSGVVEAIVDFWQYFEPVRQNMPQNCSADVQATIAHLDGIFSAGNQTIINDIKESFGLGGLTKPDDVLSALRNNLWDWQALQVTSGAGTEFYKFCDTLEIKDGEPAPASGWGVEHALPAWSNFWKTRYFTTLCGTDDAETCLGTQNATLDFWTDISVNHSYRSWLWIVCNEVGLLQSAAPPRSPSLVSRFIQPAYDLRQCQLMFPSAFPELPKPNADNINKKYKGWDVKTDRLFFANGARDPWRDATVSAQSRTVVSTPLQPVHLSDGFHCSDLGASSAVDPTIADVQAKALASMKGWLSTWKPSKGRQPIKTPPSTPNRPALPSEPHIIRKVISAWLRGVGKL